MTKKDYVAIAAAIQDVYCAPNTQDSLMARATARTMVVKLADVFEEDNGSFDRLRFLGACGM